MNPSSKNCFCHWLYAFRSYSTLTELIEKQGEWTPHYKKNSRFEHRSSNFCIDPIFLLKNPQQELISLGICLCWTPFYLMEKTEMKEEKEEDEEEEGKTFFNQWCCCTLLYSSLNRMKNVCLVRFHTCINSFD